MKIAIGSDHAGFERKQNVLEFLKDERIEYKDFGAYSEASVDYPDFAHPVASAVEAGEYNLGILICGSGQGVCMVANKHQGIRAALCWDPEIAMLSRQHNNANIICIPGRFVDSGTAIEMVRAFIDTDFEGGRHENRVNKISCA